MCVCVCFGVLFCFGVFWGRAGFCCSKSEVFFFVFLTSLMVRPIFLGPRDDTCKSLKKFNQKLFKKLQSLIWL